LAVQQQGSSFNIAMAEQGSSFDIAMAEQGSFIMENNSIAGPPYRTCPILFTSTA
jgi:hypothetical protein